MDIRELFFDELADSIEYWNKVTVDSVTSENADLEWTDSPADFESVRAVLQREGVRRECINSIIRNALRGLTDSLLLIFDGATSLAENARIDVVNKEGESIGEGLSDGFALYLADRDQSSQKQ